MVLTFLKKFTKMTKCSENYPKNFNRSNNAIFQKTLNGLENSFKSRTLERFGKIVLMFVWTYAWGLPNFTFKLLIVQNLIIITIKYDNMYDGVIRKKHISQEGNICLD